MEDFFKILSKEQKADGTYVYKLVLNKEHKVFKGHFPGKPVTPGIMSIMTVRECVEDALSIGATRLASIKDAVYFAPIIPDGTALKVSFTVDENLNVQAKIDNEKEETLTRIRATLCRQ